MNLLRNLPFKSFFLSFVFIVLGILSITFVANLISTPAYGQIANAWNLHRVGTDLNFYYGNPAGPFALTLQSNGEMRANKIYDLTTPSFLLDLDNTSTLKNISLPANGSRITFPEIVANTSYTGFGTANGDMSDGVPLYWGIGREPGGWSAPFPDLVISNHTGIRLAAHGPHGGVSIYDQFNGVSTWSSAGTQIARFRANGWGDTPGNRGSYIINTNLGIGTTDPSRKLSVVGDMEASVYYDANNPAYYVNPESISNFSRVDTKLLRVTTGTAGAGVCYDGSSFVGPCVSDARLKKNIRYFDDTFGLNVIEQLKPALYDVIKDDSRDQPGFIAQDVRKVLPNVITEGEDGYLQFSRDLLVPYMVKAIQELNTKVNKLEPLAAQIKDQQDQIDLLKKEIEELKK